jgi:hypothetical protein
LDARYQKFRRMGFFDEGLVAPADDTPGDANGQPHG